jgi:hypothetical protein
VGENSQDSTWQHIVDDEIDIRESHLCCHSDVAGTYLPMEEIKRPIIAKAVCPWRPIPGGILCNRICALSQVILYPAGRMRSSHCTIWLVSVSFCKQCKQKKKNYRDVNSTTRLACRLCALCMHTSSWSRVVLLWSGIYNNLSLIQNVEFSTCLALNVTWTHSNRSASLF